MLTTRHVLPLAMLVALWALPSRAQEADVPLVGALHRQWGLDDGLPQSSALALAQGADGHLFVGTQEGLALFDGRTWTVMDQAAGMPCEEIMALASAPDGTVWAGTAGCGLVRIHKGAITHLPTLPGQRGDRVSVLERTLDGTLWVGTDHGLARLGTNPTFTFLAALGTADVSALAPAEGGVWVGTRASGLWRVRGDNAERITPPGPLDHVTALTVDGDGGLWVGTHSDGLWYRTPAGSFEQAPSDVPSRISALRMARHGGLWVGTETAGFGRLKRNRYTQAKGVPSNAGVVAFLEDTEGSLWVGTFSSSLHQLRRAELDVVGKPEGLTDDFIWSVYEDREGAVWIGTTGGALHRWKDGKLASLYTAAEGLPQGRIFDIIQDREGALWLATSVGAARFHEGRFELLTTKDGLPSDIVYSLYEDSAGSLWFGTRAGLARRRDGQWRVFTTKDGLSRDNITNIREAVGGGLWLGSNSGLDFLDESGVRQGGPEEELAGRDVSGLVLDAQDPKVLWAATDDGLARVDASGVAVVRGRDGLVVNNVLSVADDGRGHLWMGSNRGLYRVAKSELTAFFSRQSPRVAAVLYGRSEGMRSIECNSYSNASSIRTHMGELWFATVMGAVRVPAAAEPRSRTAPPLHITKVTTRNVPVSIENGLPPGVVDVELSFVALTFVAPEKVRYRYWLEGYDEGWREKEGVPEATYTNLPPGEYRFRVRAESADGRWGPVETGVLLRRPARFFEASSFHFTLGLALVGGGLGTYRWRVGRLRARAQELSQRVEERTRELATANAELQQALDTSAEGERSLRRLIDRLPIAITVVEGDRVVYANDTSLQLLGYERFEDLAGQNMSVHVPEDERTLWDERLAALRRGELLPVRLSRVRRLDGSVALAEVSGVMLRFGGRMASVVLARDVTESRRMEERLRLSDRMSGVGTLAAGVAHEINNPLSYVIGNQQFVLERLEPLLEASGGETVPVPVTTLESLAEALRDASEGAGRVRHIVRDLKTFSRGDEESNRPLDVRPVLESALSICLNEVRHRARVRRELGEVPPVMANEARLGQVFLNLLVNAAQSIPDGQVERHEIVLRTFTDANGRAVVEVSDTGSGIAPEHLERIFDPFFTTKPVGVGTGLGLSICHGIVSVLGGDIQVESQVGKGTRFRVLLPAATEVLEVVPARPVEVVAPPTRRAKLLVVDDEPLVARGVARLLAGEYSAESTSSAKEALERLSQGERFDLMLCDVMMPEMSGEAFFHQLAEVAPDQRERVVFITGGAFTPEARAFLESLPPGRCLLKPLAADVLRALVREQLARA
ncbi:two-component regulator propeller domain-containing protein [Pyxidicoccus trucidator]|uniref:hybrid sensor histidine kinase/response regulator n=1 Tax=Pyxidicoccus trucidator TaxID=2709662 RepID=UPI0013DB8B88|nr:two-component regulator propeller domain-containing protein [Pyxidicoccus trucidator]